MVQCRDDKRRKRVAVTGSSGLIGIKRRGWLLLFGLGAVSCLAFNAWAGNMLTRDLAGNWARQDGETRIRITPCGSQLCAVNIWVRDPEGDEKLGDTLVMTLHGTSPKVLSGRAYDQGRELTYSMTISFDASGMRTSGCIFLGMLCRSAEWTRIR